MGSCLPPVICTVGARLDSGVLLVPDQPDELAVGPQADAAPGLLGDIAAVGIEVAHENEILKDMIWSIVAKLCHSTLPARTPASQAQ